MGVLSGGERTRLAIANPDHAPYGRAAVSALTWMKLYDQLKPQLVIAENIAQVAPECAIYEDDMQTPKSYRQECVIALLVKATQEQAKEIAELKARLDPAP